MFVVAAAVGVLGGCSSDEPAAVAPTTTAAPIAPTIPELPETLELGASMTFDPRSGDVPFSPAVARAAVEGSAASRLLDAGLEPQFFRAWLTDDDRTDEAKQRAADDGTDASGEYDPRPVVVAIWEDVPGELVRAMSSRSGPIGQPPGRTLDDRQVTTAPATAIAILDPETARVGIVAVLGPRAQR